LIRVEFDAVVTSGTMAITKTYDGASQITLSQPYVVVNGKNSITIKSRANNTATAYFYIYGTKVFNFTILNVKSYAIANYTIGNFTSSCVD